MSKLFTLIRREIWEHPAFYVAPLVVTAIMVLALAADTLVFGQNILRPTNFVQFLQMVPDAARQDVYGILMIMPAFIPYAIVLVFVIFFYLMDCLYAERKDRSILFWKSLPVSDTETVFSKIATAMFTIPLVTLVVYLVSTFGFFVVLTFIVWAGGGNPWTLLWSAFPVFEVAGLITYSLLVQSFWFLPFIGWVALASAFARRMPFLWVVLVPVGVVIVETFLFGTREFIGMIGARIEGVFKLSYTDEDLHFDFDDMEELQFENTGSILDVIDPTPLLTSTGFWGGLVVGGGLIAAAIWLRRYRDDS
ncbi:MAG: hypothetical protein AAF438_07795 [Pseudomonadota bacterium]